MDDRSPTAASATRFDTSVSSRTPDRSNDDAALAPSAGIDADPDDRDIQRREPGDRGGDLGFARSADRSAAVSRTWAKDRVMVAPSRSAGSGRAHRHRDRVKLRSRPQFLRAEVHVDLRSVDVWGISCISSAAGVASPDAMPITSGRTDEPVHHRGGA